MCSTADLLRQYAGSILAAASSICFTLMEATAQSCMRDGLGAGQVVFIRMLGTALVLFLYLYMQRPEHLLQLDPRSRLSLTLESSTFETTLIQRQPTRAARLIWLRSVLSTAGLCLGYASMKLIALSEFSTVYSTRMFFIGFLCWVVLREPFGWRLRLAAVISTLAVLLVVQPPFLFGSAVSTDPAARMLGFLLVFASVLSEVVEMVVLRILGPGPDALTVTLAYSVASVFLGPIFAVSAGEQVRWSISLTTSLKLLLLAVLGLSAQMRLVLAMQRETGAMVGVMSYAQIPFVLLVQSLLVHELPNLDQLAGMSAIIISGVWAVVAETSRREVEKAYGQAEEYILLSQEAEDEVEVLRP